MCWARSLQSIDLCQNYFICEEPLTRAFDGYCHIFTSNVFGLWIFDHEARRCDADIWRKIQSCMICVPENRSIEAVKSSHHDEPVSVLTGYLQKNSHQVGFLTTTCTNTYGSQLMKSFLVEFAICSNLSCLESVFAKSIMKQLTYNNFQQVSTEM